MERTPLEDIAEATRLSSHARSSGRWYTRYLLIFAIVSFALSMGFALIGPRWGAVVLTPIWVIVVAMLSVYANRQRTQVRGLTRTHLWMMAGWTVAWLVTVIGSFQVDQALWWWLLGGVAMAAPALIARHVVLGKVSAP